MRNGRVFHTVLTALGATEAWYHAIKLVYLLQRLATISGTSQKRTFNWLVRLILRSFSPLWLCQLVNYFPSSLFTPHLPILSHPSAPRLPLLILSFDHYPPKARLWAASPEASPLF